ncbi:MAG: class B sortase [Oscillospiraceae bacterium]|nr:class B sortase [Oscillospiraceae bacterium]
MKKKDTKKRFSLILTIACFTILALYLTACGDVAVEPEPEETTPLATTEAETTPAVTEFPDMLEEYLDLWEQNNDMVGFLKVGDKISEPVMQAEDNLYYTDHDFNKNPQFHGAITADYKNVFNGYDISDNTLLYGHNMKNGTFFKPLQTMYYSPVLNNDLSFYKETPVINFDSMYEKMEWKVFAVVLHNTQEEYGEVIKFWEHIDFKTKDKFHEYILKIMDRSVLLTDVDIEYGDKILSLMTCWYPDGLDCRIVVYARKVRPGESSEVDVSKAKSNKVSNVYGSGNKWTGEEGLWDADKYLTSYKKNSPSSTTATTATTTAAR